MGCKYFLPVYSLSLYSLNSIFDRVKVLNLDKVQFIDFFCVCASGIVSNLGSQKLFPMFFPTGFIPLCFTFVSMTHFKLIFVSKVRFLVKVHVFTDGWPTVTKQYVEKTILSSINWFCIFVKDQMLIFIWSTSGLLILLHWFIINPIPSWLLKLDTESDSSIFVLFQICFRYSSSLAFTYKL